jgi:hypothetical protein
MAGLSGEARDLRTHLKVPVEPAVVEHQPLPLTAVAYFLKQVCN